MEAVYKLQFDCGRNGSLTGIFIEEKELVDALVKSKIEIYFGEVLGKHSEVCGPIEENEIMLISDSSEVISIIKEHDLENGFNPFYYNVSYNSLIEILGEDRVVDELSVRDAVKLYIERK
jgi:hypothetical protein